MLCPPNGANNMTRKGLFSLSSGLSQAVDIIIFERKNTLRNLSGGWGGQDGRENLLLTVPNLGREAAVVVAHHSEYKGGMFAPAWLPFLFFKLIFLLTWTELFSSNSGSIPALVNGRPLKNE